MWFLAVSFLAVSVVITAAGVFYAGYRYWQRREELKKRLLSDFQA